MKAIAIVPQTTDVDMIEVPVPGITAGTDVKLKVLQVGICGTDREQVSGGRADAPAGKDRLVIGHEMFGQVCEVGSAVTTVSEGDYGVFIVRRGCGKCMSCQNGRSDLCFTGDYTERGIKGADGFQAAFVVDKEEYLVKVPDEMKEIGVLTEPMSVASKAITEALTIQKARFKDFVKEGEWLNGKKALIAGVGAIGLLAAFTLRLRGAEVVGMDIVDENSLRPRILTEIGGRYVDGREVDITNLDEKCGAADFVFEATGVPSLQVELIDALAINGIYVVTGIPGENRPHNIPLGDLLQQFVLKNQIMIGSVNASLEHYKTAVADLHASLQRWPDAVRKLITAKYPSDDFQGALHGHSADEIKVVVEWN
jgi:glucose 1-dehydrogenase